jgi:hypothetical protein
MESNDGYLGGGTNTLSVKMHVIQPGDSIRVVTEHHVIPEPVSLRLLGKGLVAYSPNAGSAAPADACFSSSC